MSLVLRLYGPMVGVGDGGRHWCWLGDLHRAGHRGGLRHAAHEALGMGGVGGGEYHRARGDPASCASAVDVRRREQAETAVVMPGVVPGEERLAEPRAARIEPKGSGKSGRYLSVLNCASENGLSCGDANQ